MSDDGTAFDCERRLQAFASGVSHELGTCMVGVLANAELLARSLPPDGAEAHMVRDVLRAGERAAELAREMRAYAGKSQLEPRAVTIDELVRDIGAGAIAATTRLCLEIDAELPSVWGDHAQLRRTLEHLLANAEDALDGKPKQIVLRARCAPIDRSELLRDHLPPTAAGNVVHLEVHDDGVGMTAETMQRIFDPFWTSKPAARGLGLSVVLGSMRGHRGGIRVQSTPGCGSMFGLVFAPYDPVKTTVLVIDDEPLVRDGLRRILKSRGYTVLDAANGASGLALLDQHPELRVVILDVMMPDMSGLEVLEHIRARRPKLPVLVSSACADLPSHVADGFLVKPYGPQKVFDALEALLSSR